MRLLLKELHYQFIAFYDILMFSPFSPAALKLRCYKKLKKKYEIEEEVIKEEADSRFGISIYRIYACGDSRLRGCCVPVIHG